MGTLDGKVALVTGAAQGIGRAIADGLSADGARIVVADLQGAEDAAGTYPGGVGLTVDVADEAAVERMVAETLERCGAIDVLVNNAGLYASLAMRPFTEIPLDEWRRDGRQRRLDVPHVPCSRACDARAWRRGDRQHLLRHAVPRRPVPAPLRDEQGSDRRLHACARAGARPDGIRVNCVAPGFTMSDGVKEHPEVIEQLRDVSVAARTIQRDQLPEDVVGAVAYLAGPAASFVTGQTIVIDGGQYFH